MKIRGRDIGVCSWSLRPSNIDDLADKVRQCGLDTVQLALGELAVQPAEEKRQSLAALRRSGLRVASGMIAFPGEDYTTIADIHRTGGYAPDAQWPARRELSRQVAELARELSLTAVSTHVGFVAFDPAKLVERTRIVADDLAAFGLTLLLETGQESGPGLIHFLDELDRPNVRINFDPANMILYGAGDPIEAVAQLGPLIAQVHIKDATASARPGESWGEEVPFGTGQVGARRFLDALDRAGFSGAMMIEREAGENRIGDVRHAIQALKASEP